MDSFSNWSQYSTLADTMSSSTESPPPVGGSQKTWVGGVYVAIGTVGFGGNLLVFVIIRFFTNLTDKVSCTVGHIVDLVDATLQPIIMRPAQYVSSRHLYSNLRKTEI